MNSHTHREFRVRSTRPFNVLERPYEDARQSVRTVTSSSLFAGGREITIDHGGALYRLKITRQGKLILNK